VAMNEKNLHPSPEEQKLRVDAFLAQKLGISKSQAQRWCAQNRVRHVVMGTPVSKGDLVPEGGLKVQVEQTIDFTRVGDMAPFFEDEHVFVVNKPAGLPTLPKHKDDFTSDCVAYRLAKHYSWARDLPQRDYGLVHRLDNDTSGLLVAAKDRQTYDTLRDQWGTGVFKGYVCLMPSGIQKPVRVDAAVAHHGGVKEKMTVAGLDTPIRGAPVAACTSFLPVTVRHDALLALAILETAGVRHQIRVHAAHLGCPLVGDVLYGGSAHAQFSGQALHAACVRLPGRAAMFCPVPANFTLAGTKSGVDKEAFEQLQAQLSEISAK
tara:strand:+ start:204 stop:1166 length:963 start_codon:yes stop_codon:yes gene_type:complete